MSNLDEKARFPDGVKIHGPVTFGKRVSICEPAEINATGSSVVIGDDCDIAAYVTINVADSHLRCIGLADEIERQSIMIGDHVFVGTGAVILGGCHIGHHSVIGAGVVIKGAVIPPYSLLAAPAPVLRAGYFLGRAYNDMPADYECAADCDCKR